MSFDSNLPPNQGNTKISELAVDRVMPLFPTSGPQENALVTLQTAFQALTELSRKSNYILRSEGQMHWTGTELRFDAEFVVNSINLEILASEGTVNRAFQLRMQGSTTSNGTNTFLNIPMADGDLLYLELDSTLLVDLGGVFNLDNAASGTGTTAGFRVVKQPMTTAMPKLQIGAAGGGSLFHIPLALRRGTDIFFIPHGFLFPAGTVSSLGAILVDGLSAYPEQFVTDQLDLLLACSALSVGGGVILIKAPFSVNQVINVPDSVKILGRGLDKNAITLVPGGNLTLGNRCKLESLQIITAALWTGQAIAVNGNRSRVLDCRVDLSASASSSSVQGIAVTGSRNRIKDCILNGVTASSRIGINYVSGADNADIDCEDT